MSPDKWNKTEGKSLALIFLGLILISSLCWPGQEGPPDYSSAIRIFEKFVEVQMRMDRAPGLTVGFMKDNFVWTRGFGFSDLENSVRAVPESAYRLASITKTMTAIAVLRLAEQGKVDLEAEVQKYVPYFPRKKWPVTVGLLLGHLGGISHYRDYSLEGRIREAKNTKEALAIFQNFELLAKPGTRYNYSSYGYNLLGAVIEGASGESYGDFIRSQIFEPLGMTHSRLDNPADLIPLRVRGYRMEKGELKNSHYVDVSSRFAGGGTRSTVPDLLAYARGICQGKLLDPSSWRKMFRSMSTDNGFYTGYGMGWSVSPWNGHFRVFHGGSQPETRTFLIIFPLENFAVAIASNLEGINLTPYYSHLASLVLEENLLYPAYLTDLRSQLIMNVLGAVWSHGLSQHMWSGASSISEEDSQQAFAYFNALTDPGNKEPLTKLGRKLEAGFHPSGGERLILMGRYMAAHLERNREGNFKGYIKKGPLAFFNDYVAFTQSRATGAQSAPKICSPISEQIARWQRQWGQLPHNDFRFIHFTTGTNFEELGRLFKDRFAGKDIYPDFSGDIAGVGRRFLRQGQPEKSIPAFRLTTELYGKAPAAWSELAEAYVWLNNPSEARINYDRALSLDAGTVHASAASFRRLAKELRDLKKTDEALTAVSIGSSIHPKNGLLYEDAGDLHVSLGARDEALELYRQARALLPKRKELKNKIDRLKKR